MRNQAWPNSNEAQQSENEKAILNLKNKIEENFKKLFTEKYEKVVVGADNGRVTKQFEDSLFSGNVNSEYLNNLDQYFKKKGYNLDKNNIDKNNKNLDEASRFYKIITSKDPSDLKEKENRFEIFKNKLQQIDGEALLRNLVNNLDEKLTTEESEISENSNQKMPKRKRRDTSSLQSINAKQLAKDCLEQRSLEFRQIATGKDDEKEQKLQSLANSLFNDINLYSLFETLFHIKDIESTHASKQETEYYFSASLKRNGDADIVKLNEPIINNIKKALPYPKTTHNSGDSIYYLIQQNQQKLYFQFNATGLTTATVEQKKDVLLGLVDKIIESDAKLQNLSLLSPEFFVTRLVNNFKSTFGKEIEDDLRQTIESISNVPQDIDKVFDLLKNDASGIPSIISQLKAVENAFTISTKDLKDKINKFVGEDGNLTKLFRHFKIDYSYFNEVGKSLDGRILKYVSSLKQDIEHQIKEKKFIIEQITVQYLSAYNKVAKEINPATTDAVNIDSEVVKEVEGMGSDLQEKIKHNLPLWVRDGFDLVDLIIDEKPVKFIFNKPQADIIKALQKNDPSEQLKFVSSEDFYLGTGGGKTHLIELLQGTQGRKIKGSDGQDYSAEQIKEAIFGNANVVIKSINFHVFYNGQNEKTDEKIKEEIDCIFNKLAAQSSIKKSQGQDVQYIIPLDEYHLFPKYAKEYLINKARQSGIKTLFIKSTATPNSMDMLYKSLKETTKTKPEKVVEENKSKIVIIQHSIDRIGFTESRNEDYPASQENKYHIIIDPSIKDDENVDSILKTGIKKAEQNPQRTFVIARKNEEGNICCYLFKKGELVETKPDNKGNTSKALNVSQLREKLSDIDNDIEITYTFSTSTGGDLEINDFAGKTKITVKITDDMKDKYSATEMVAFIRQAVGRDRTFNWKDINSFNNVKLIGITKEELRKILEQAKNFENLNAEIKQGNDKKITLADPKKLYCSKDINKIKDLISLRLKKNDLASFDIKAIANIFSAIEIFEEMNLSYEDIYKRVAKFCSPPLDENEINNKNKFDVIFSLHKLFKFIAPFQQPNQVGKNKGFVDQIIESYKNADISKKKIIDKLTKNKKPEDVIKNQIFSSKFTKSLQDEGLNFNENDIRISSIDIYVTEDGALDIKFKYSVSFNSISCDKNTKLLALLKAHLGSDNQADVKFSKIQESVKHSQERSDKIKSLGGEEADGFSETESVYQKFDLSLVEPLVNNEKAEPDNSVEARAIVHLFENVLGDKDNKFTDENKELIDDFYFSSSSSSDKVLSKEEKLAIVKSALLQRNKYNENGGKNTDKDRAGEHYKALKKTLQNLNKKNIKFTTESLKLFNVDNKTLGTRQEIDELIAKKPLFVRAMGNVGIYNFQSITKDLLGVNEPSNNILLAKPDGVASKSIRVKLMKLESRIQNTQ